MKTKTKFLILAGTLLLSVHAVAAPPEHRGKGPRIPEARDINSNRQSDADSSRGLERAWERHEMENREHKDGKPQKGKKHKKQ